MKEISIPYTIGNKESRLRITFPNGGAGLGHIYIGNRYQGQITKQASGWQVFLNKKSELTPEDIEVLKEIVQKAE